MGRAHSPSGDIASSPASAASAGLSARLYGWSGVGIVVLALLLKLWAMRQWSWFQDDWSYLERTADFSFWPYVTQNYNGHFMPLQFVIVWVMTMVSPLNYGLAILVLATIIAAGMLTWWAFFQTVFGPRPQVLLGLAIIAFCPLLLQPTLWWASGMQTYGLIWGMAAVLLCLYQYLSKGRLWLVGALVSFALACAAWEKALLIMIPAAFLILVLPGLDRRSSEFRRRAAWAAGALSLIAVAFAGMFLLATARPVTGSANLALPGPEGLLGFALTAGLGILAPSVIGGTWQSVGGLQGAFPMAPTWMQWALAFGAVALAVVALSIRRAASWGLLLPAVYALAAWGLVVGSSRFGNLGQFASLDSRYSADIVPAIALGLVFVTTSTRWEREGGGAWLQQLSGPVVRAFHIGTASVAAAIIVSSLITWSIQMDGLGPNSPRPWTDELIGSARSVGTITAFDSNAPGNVIYPAFLPKDARISRMIAPLSVPIAFDSPTQRLYAVAGNGKFVPAKINVQSRSIFGPVGGCGYYVEPGRPPVEVPMSAYMYNWNWGVEVGYLAQVPATLEIAADLATETMPLAPGLGTMQTVMVTSVSKVFLSVPPDGAPVCIDYVGFGPVDPEARS